MPIIGIKFAEAK